MNNEVDKRERKRLNPTVSHWRHINCHTVPLINPILGFFWPLIYDLRWNELKLWTRKDPRHFVIRYVLGKLSLDARDPLHVSPFGNWDQYGWQWIVYWTLMVLIVCNKELINLLIESALHHIPSSSSSSSGHAVRNFKTFPLKYRREIVQVIKPFLYILSRKNVTALIFSISLL